MAHLLTPRTGSLAEPGEAVEDTPVRDGECSGSGMAFLVKNSSRTSTSYKIPGRVVGKPYLTGL
jgi:hypothetical protein